MINQGIFFESKAVSDEKIMKFVSSVPGKNSWEGDSNVDWFNFTRISVQCPQGIKEKGLHYWGQSGPCQLPLPGTKTHYGALLITCEQGRWT